MVGGVQPDSRLEQHLHLRGETQSLCQTGQTNLRSEHVGQAGRGPLQGDPPEEEDGEDEVGEEGREVNDFPGGRNTWRTAGWVTSGRREVYLSS